MKCTNCGNNNVTFHYKAVVNGSKKELHLCPECAEKLGYTNDSFFGGDPFEDMFSDFFSGFFGGRNRFPMFGGMLMPVLAMPRMELEVRRDGAAETAEPAEKPAEADSKLSRRREMNALREQMKAAVKAEEFEKAAELRDKLREMEK